MPSGVRGARSATWISMVVSGCVADAAPGVRLPEMRIREAPVIASPIEIPSGISPENDGFGFALALDLRVVGNALTVLENGNSRLVLFDSAFRAVRTIGSEGSGPGELRGSFSLDVADGVYAVGEINNARISLFDTSGAFLKSVGAAGDASFAFGSGQTLYVASGSVDNYLVRIDARGLQRPFGDRPLHLYPAEVQRDRVPPGVGRELVATSAGGDVFVFDRVLAGLVRFDSGGAYAGVTVLPKRLRDGLLEHRKRAYADFGDRRPVYEVAMGDLTRTDRGNLLLLFPVVERTFGLLFDPDGNLATRIEWPEGSIHAELGEGGGFGVVSGNTFYRGLGDHVTVFRLEPAR